MYKLNEEMIMKMTYNKKSYFKRIISVTLLLLAFSVLSTALISCKEKIIVNTQAVTSEAIIATVKIPEYERYPEFSAFIKEEIEKDFLDYKKYAEMDYPYSGITSTYRTETEDFSNTKYLNCFIKKYIYAGENIEDEYFITFVLNKKTKQIETLENLSGKKIEEISKYCEKMLISDAKWESDYEYNVISDDIKTGTRPVQRNYRAFVASKKNITIYFAPGQVRSKWFGPQTVTISYK